MNIDWPEFAKCRGVDIEVFFPNAGEGYAKARRYCFQCPVRMACLEDALAAEAQVAKRSSLRHGMFGGATPDERADMKWIYELKVGA